VRDVDVGCFPSGDEAFRRAVEEAIQGGAKAPEALEEALRGRYPKVRVKQRDPMTEVESVGPLTHLYVFRDGSYLRAPY
jgi:hypothetical protein